MTHDPSRVAGADPFAGLASVLTAAPVQVDPHRQARKGVPEVVYALGKPPRVTLAAVRALLARTPSGRVLVSRPNEEVVALLRREVEVAGGQVLVAQSGAILRANRPAAGEPAPTGGVVGLLTAGASDAPAADEAAWVAHEMGCEVVRADDVGVAGLHRL